MKKLSYALAVCMLFGSSAWAQPCPVSSENTSKSSPESSAMQHIDPRAQVCLQQNSGLSYGVLRTDDGQALDVVIVANPMVNDSVDCRANTFMFPFIDVATFTLNNDEFKNVKTGVWLAPRSVDTLLSGDGWEKTTVENAKVDDVILGRTNGTVTDIAYISSIHRLSGEEKTNNDTYFIELTKKSDGGVIERYALKYPSEFEASIEVWTPADGKTRTGKK